MTARVEAAARTVTLLGISGADGPRFAGALERNLGDLYTLVPGDRYRSGAERLHLPGATPDEVRAVAGSLGIDAVIGGAVVGQGAARRLLIAVRDGTTGRVVARGRYDLGGRTLPMIREQVLSDIVRALEHVSAGSGPRQPLAAAPEGTPKAPAAASAPVPLEDVAPAVAEDQSVARAAGPAASARAGIYAGVGPSLLTRRLHFDVPSAPRYDGGTVAGIRVEGAVFPLALSAELAAEHPVLASFALAGMFEQLFDFTSSTVSGSSRGSASRFAVLFLGRVPLGHRALAGTLTIDSGWQRLSYSARSPVDIGVPNVRYDAFAAGLGWDRPLAGRWLLLALRGGLLAGISFGDIALANQYGPARGLGASAQASLTTWPASWLWLRLAASYDHMSLSFAAAGSRLAHSAGDDWVGGALEVGFAL